MSLLQKMLAAAVVPLLSFLSLAVLSPSAKAVQGSSGGSVSGVISSYHQGNDGEVDSFVVAPAGGGNPVTITVTSHAPGTSDAIRSAFEHDYHVVVTYDNNGAVHTYTGMTVSK
jgi:hypothetical protein